MAVPALARPFDLPPVRTRGWVIDRTNDLAFLIGGALVAFGFLAAHVVFGVSAVVLYMLWVLAIDGPHVFATVSRTYLDPEERGAHGRLLRASLVFFVLGPAIVAGSILMGTRLPYEAFLGVCTLWAYWHVVRQHYGVLVLYERKTGDDDPVESRIDAAVLYVGLLAPLVAFAVGNERALASVGIAEPPAWSASLATAAWGLVVAAALALVGHQLARHRAGHAVPWTKLLFVAAATSVSIVLFAPPVADRIQYEVIVPVVTSFHNVQYLALVWFYHRNRAGRGRGAAVPLAARRLWVFLGLGVCFTLAYRVGLGCIFSAWPTCDLGAETMLLPGGLFSVSDLGVAFLWGFALHHYYLDQRIWHVRRDAGLRRDLQLADAA